MAERKPVLSSGVAWSSEAPGVSCRGPFRLEDAEAGTAMGEGQSIPLRLGPGQVVFARLSRR
jgi:hypothetical protein